MLYGLDADAIPRLADGARAVIVEGPMDHLAIQRAADHAGLDLVPIATCGSALTDAHLDLLGEHTALDRVILGFDADTAGRKASLAAGRKLIARGVTPAEIETFVSPAGTDAAEILAADGSDRLAALLGGPDQHITLLDLLVDEKLSCYDGSTRNRPLRELPVASHAAYEATRFVAETVRESVCTGHGDPAQIQRQLMRISERTGTDLQQLNAYMIDVAFPDDDYQQSATAATSGTPSHLAQSTEPELRSEVETDVEPGLRIDDALLDF